MSKGFAKASEAILNCDDDGYSRRQEAGGRMQKGRTRRRGDTVTQTTQTSFPTRYTPHPTPPSPHRRSHGEETLGESVCCASLRVVQTDDRPSA
ncbi:MAG: hypothetical protein KME27_11535 [Lyngbya sp. HA4199-MV5]|nr:hypothetical protein [Lyngbya sp. HA4199-MV5]